MDSLVPHSLEYLDLSTDLHVLSGPLSMTTHVCVCDFKMC